MKIGIAPFSDIIKGVIPTLLNGKAQNEPGTAEALVDATAATGASTGELSEPVSTLTLLVETEASTEIVFLLLVLTGVGASSSTCNGIGEGDDLGVSAVNGDDVAVLIIVCDVCLSNDGKRSNLKAKPLGALTVLGVKPV